MGIQHGKRPLDGIRVLEMGSLIAGPFATRLLSDFGAEVIKVESGEGDPLRTWGRTSPSGSSWWWHVQSRNKKLMVVNLRTEEGQDVIRQLIPHVDALVENFRPGRLEAWGLGYDALKQLNPGLVYTSVSGFGQTGPYRKRPGFGNIAESMGGIRNVTGFPDRPPVRVGLSLGDEVAALYAVIGTLMSLLHRERDTAHEGDHVDVALTEAVFSLTEGSLTEYLHTGAIQERSGNQLHRTAPSNIYPTKEGRWVAIGANSQQIFPRLMRAMGQAYLAHDPRFIDNASRVTHADELDGIIGAWTSQFTMNEVMERLTNAEVPAGPVMNVADISEDQQFQARDMIVKVPSEELGQIQMPGVVPRLTEHPGYVAHDGHRLGHDTDSVLQELLGWTQDVIDDAKKRGVIA